MVRSCFDQWEQAGVDAGRGATRRERLVPESGREVGLASSFICVKIKLT